MTKRSKQEIEWQKSEVLRKREARLKRNDPRPICCCNAYKFPHKIGGKCTGKAFFEFYFYCDRSMCDQCNLYNDDRSPNTCDALDGIESIKESECYRERLHQFPSGALPLTFDEQI